MIRYLFVLFFILLLVYIFLFSPLFKIKSVKVSGNKELSAEDIKNVFSYKNIFLFTKSKIKDDLMAKFPKISDLEIDKNIIKRMIGLEVKERERAGVICRISSSAEATEDKGEIRDCFYIDKGGIIFEEAPQTSGSLILLIKDYSQRDFDIGKEIFERKIINSIFNIKEKLFEETGIKPLDFSVSSSPPKDLKIMTSEGWYVIFDLERDINVQLLSLKVALEEKIKDREGLEYIDLRIENRIYYK